MARTHFYMVTWKKCIWIFLPGLRIVRLKERYVISRKSLHGLKQSPRAWFDRFLQAMIRYGFRQSQGDHTLFIKHSSKGKVTALIVYVEDIVLTGDDLVEMKRLKTYLTKEFEIKDLGD